jgi:hypothetical protein
MTLDKRLKRFNKEFGYLSSNPFYKKIRVLYVNDIIKNTQSVKKAFSNIKYTKKGELYKTSIKKAEELNIKYINFSKKSNERVIDDITQEKIFNDNLGIYTHFIELHELQKKFPKSYIKQVVRFYNKNGNLSKSKSISIDKKLVGKYRKEVWTKIINTFSNGTSEQVWEIEQWADKGRYASITTTAYENKQPNQINIQQKYKDNESKTCVYDGFVKFFSNSNNKNKKIIYNRLIKNKDTYAKEYTDETLIEICNLTNSTLIIKDLIRGKEFDKIITPSKAQSKFTIQFLNTKFNHLDLLTHSYDKITEVNDDEFEKVKNKADFYIETFGQLITTDNIYKIKDDEFQIVYKQWKEKINYNQLLINTNNEEMQLIKDYDYSMHHFINDFKIDNKLYSEIDIEKAYFYYSDKSKNPNYHGVPSGSFINTKCPSHFTIKHFDEQLNNKLIGFYQVEIEKINNYNEIFKKISIIEGKTYVFTSTQINTFKQYMTFKFINCSLSPPAHIPFTKDFLENKSYCKAVGLMMCENDHITITIKPLVCDMNYYQIIKNDEFTIYDDKKIVKINNKKDIIKSCHHIAYYIHSYIKVLIFQQLLQVNINDVFGIKLDSIVIKKDASIRNIITGFHKTLKAGNIETLLKNQNKNIGYYIDELDGFLTYGGEEKSGLYGPYYKQSEQTINFKSSFLPNQEIITNNNIFLGGKGGSGKTHSVLSFFPDVCFISMCWNLTENKKLEFPNIKTLSINRAVGDKCEQEYIYNKVIFWDELTMAHEKDILKLKKLYPYKIFIYAGDIDFNGKYYQCNVKNKVINPSTLNCQYVKYIQNYRFDNELNKILDGLRLTKNKFELTNYIKKHFKNNYKTKEDIIFDEKTVGISDLQDNEELTNYFISKGTKERYFVKNTNYNNQQYRGATIDDITLHNNYEMKLFKTTHSYQGLDIKQDEKLIICINNYEEYEFNYLFRLVYTAFSRARRLNQIILLK